MKKGRKRVNVSMSEDMYLKAKLLKIKISKVMQKALLLEIEEKSGLYTHLTMCADCKHVHCQAGYEDHCSLFDEFCENFPEALYPCRYFDQD